MNIWSWIMNIWSWIMNIWYTIYIYRAHTVYKNCIYIYVHVDIYINKNSIWVNYSDFSHPTGRSKAALSVCWSPPFSKMRWKPRCSTILLFFFSGEEIRQKNMLNGCSWHNEINETEKTESYTWGILDFKSLCYTYHRTSVHVLQAFQIPHGVLRVQIFQS